jgi:hypothetical protein
MFHRGSVEELTSGPLRSSVATHLGALVRKELIRPDKPFFAAEDAYRFRHLLIRDAAYESIPKEVRAELHERHVDWLETKTAPSSTRRSSATTSSRRFATGPSSAGPTRSAVPSAGAPPSGWGRRDGAHSNAAMLRQV